MSQTAKHTPGPWFPQQCGETGYNVYGGRTGAVKIASVNGWNMAEREANARLIAATPQVLHALYAAEIAVDQLCVGQDPENECWQTLRDIRAAIAKVEGR